MNSQSASNMSLEEIRLRENHIFILNEIEDPKDIARHLYQKMVISQDDLERINNLLLTRKDRIEILLMRISLGQGKAFHSFISILRETGYGHVADRLEETDEQGSCWIIGALFDHSRKENQNV